MKEAIIYGGAFSPPTVAHQEILKACIDVAATTGAEVWLLPSGTRADKELLGGVEERIRLTDALCRSVGNVAVTLKTETCELLQAARTETFQTQAVLAEQFPEYRQTWVFGADSIATMKQWGNGQLLWENLSMLVIPRQGVELMELPPLAKILPVVTEPVSSTLVRERLAEGAPVDGLVPPEVQHVLQSV